MLILFKLIIFAYFLLAITLHPVAAYSQSSGDNKIPISQLVADPNWIKKRFVSSSSELPPSAYPRHLPKSKNYGKSPLAKQAQELFDSIPDNDALLMIKEGEIIFEGYKKGFDRSTRFISMSMSKSLTAYTLGKQFCEGKISNLNDLIGSYAPSLPEGSMYKTISIYNALRMSSGNKAPVYAGTQIHGMYARLTRDGTLTMKDILGPDISHSAVEQGKRFRYNSSDTISISRVIADISHQPNMLSEFKRLIWHEVRPSSSGFWLTDRTGDPIAYAGLYATLIDWGRMAMWSLEKVGENTCFGDFMRNATKNHIANVERTGPQGKAFKGYGFQTWIRIKPNHQEFWWVGYGGQRVGVDPSRNLVLVSFSSGPENYVGGLYKLFN